MTKKIALITGGSRGLGKAFAEVFAKNGYSLILIARNLEQLTQVQLNLSSQYQCEVKILSLDLTLPESIDTLVSTFKEELSQVDVLVNNAGMGIGKSFAEMSEKEVTDCVALNINALTRITNHVLPHMVARKSGSILNVSSVAAFMPGPHMALYYASKSYVLSLSEALSEECRNTGVTISALCSGNIATEFLKRAGMQHTNLAKIPAMSAAAVAEAGYSGLMKKRRVIIPGIDNKIVHFLVSLTPQFINIKLAKILNRKL